ncbi:MAG: KAP family P-loop NTPase fold protein [Paraclostridium sp.]
MFFSVLLLAIFSEIESQIKESDSRLKQQLDNVKNKINPFTKLATTAGVKMLTAGALNLDNVNLGDYNESELIDLAGKLGDLAIKEISASKKVRSELKKEMVKYQNATEKKIIFFIDELDRCRPSFAIELLEVIKHLFDIDNFIFVISIDKEQLSHSVSTIYGHNMDTVGYLRRFFDLDYKLPKVDIKKYIDIKNSTTFDGYSNVDCLKVFIKELFVSEKFSLRDIEKAYYYIELLLPLIKPFNDSTTNYKSTYIAVISYIYANLITTKIKKPIVYKKIVDADYNLDDILKSFTTPDFSNYRDYIGGWHHKSLQSLIDPLFEIYLNLNLKISTIGNIYNFSSEDFIVGLKNEDGSFVYDSKFDLLNLFKEKDYTIHDKLEFIDGF